MTNNDKGDKRDKNLHALAMGFIAPLIFLFCLVNENVFCMLCVALVNLLCN